MFKKLWKILNFFFEKIEKNHKFFLKEKKNRKNNWKMINSSCIHISMIYCQYTCHSAYVATSTESHGVKFDGFKLLEV